MKKITLMLIMALLLMVNVSHAGPVWIEGYVTNPAGRGIPGATLTWSFAAGDRVITTDAEGHYEFLNDRGWCDAKWVWIRAAGYFSIRRGVLDGSCCDCYPDPDDPKYCDPANPYTQCTNYMSRSWTLFGPDGDQDGYYNAEDNCPLVPNGYLKGTCRAGKTGKVCYKQADCGCGAPPLSCSMSQEDSDSDGIGDVCDSNPYQSATHVAAPVFYDACASDADFNAKYLYLCNPPLAEEASEQDMTQAKLLKMSSHQDVSTRLTILGLFITWYCQTEGCDHECLGQYVEDFLNGRDYFWGRPTRPEPVPLTYECPDVPSFQELVNLLMDNFISFWFDFLYGDNFPSEG